MSQSEDEDYEQFSEQEGEPQSESSEDQEQQVSDDDQETVETESDTEVVELVTKSKTAKGRKRVSSAKNEIVKNVENDKILFCLEEIKKDHLSRPLWIGSDFKIYFESFSPFAKEAQDLLISIAEPITRPKRIHEFKLTEYSLYAALSLGLDTNAIIEGLEKLSKSDIPKNVVDFIKQSTKSYAKVKLILKDNSYWIESRDDLVLKKLLADPVISQARIGSGFVVSIEKNDQTYVIPQKSKKTRPKVSTENQVDDDDTRLLDFFDIDQDDDFKDVDPDEFFNENDPETNEITDITPNMVQHEELAKNTLPDPDGQAEDIHTVHSFEIRKESVEAVKKKSSELSFPMLEEYDFKADDLNPSLDIDLKPAAKLRPYQEKCLGKMFGNSRARSGIIVLPCGAGKTLVGVTAACTIKKSVLVLCNSSLSVEQWAREFKYWSTIKETDIAKFSSESREKFSGNAGVLISTYTMVTFSKKRAYDAQKIMDFIQSREWGFLLLDEVHVVPAEMFKRTLSIVAAHTKLGLTATLVREDEKITTLNWLIGPKLYEANWMELASHGYIANVQCAEVWCDMATPFFREYLKATSRKRQLLYVMNPKKIQACQYLINLHESMGDKTIVFSDNIFALKHYADKMHKPFIYGGTSQSERMRVLQQFRFNPALNTIFLSKIGDTSIDLPEATCLIQISSQYGSRRQEAQRLGRILRPKRESNSKFTAYFYSLVSTDTEEMFYATKRQQFLVDQGYEFKIITNIGGDAVEDGTLYSSLQDQLALLNTVLLSSQSDLVEEDENDDDVVLLDTTEELSFTRRTTNTLSSLSGSDSMAYLEFNRRKRKEPLQ